jgi:hypothetical protein
VRTSFRRRLGLLLGLCALLAALPAAARAELQTIDFESGAALGSPINTIGDITFLQEPGFRPYRTDVGTHAHSGTAVGDLGRCFEETGKGSECEFVRPHTTAVLARTAQSITVFAGRFDTQGVSNPLGTATLTAFHGGPNGTPVATSGPIPVTNDFNARLTVTSANDDIDSFTVTASNAAVGIDDVEASFAGSQPDFSVAATDQIVPLVQGQQTQIPVRLSRVNGSNGTLRLSIRDLPPGVTGSFSPALVTGTNGTSTLTLTASQNADDSDFHARTATITADPQGDQNVAPAPRTAFLSVRVARSFQLSSGDQTDANQLWNQSVEIAAPQCAPVDVPLQITRDIAMTRDVTLSVESAAQGGAPELPNGVTAEILDSPVVAPGGSVVAQRTLRLTVQPSAQLPPEGLALLLLAKADGAPAHTLKLSLFHLSPTAEVASTSTGSNVVHTPRFQQDGSRVRITGDGFCPGTRIRVGADTHEEPATVVDDHTLEFTVPRYALSGPVKILPPAYNADYVAGGQLVVDDVRNTDGFQFANPSFGALSWSELTRAFGDDDAWLNVNPCWPFGDCTVNTGIENPLALVEWPVLRALTDGAHCFGISVAIQDFLSGKESDRGFANPAPATINAIPSESGPGPDLKSLLNVDQVKQFSDEFASAYFERPESIYQQFAVIKQEFAQHRYAMVTLHGPGHFDGHTVLAYDMVRTGPTTVRIYTYNSNLPSVSDKERLSPDGHQYYMDLSTILIDEAEGIWTFPDLKWTGKLEDGSLWAVPYGTVPANPSLPKHGAVASFLFGSAGGAAVPVGQSAGTQPMPSQQGTPGQGSGGEWVARAGAPASVTIEGVKAGSFAEAYTGPGFAASVTGVATAKGVRDTLTGSGDGISLASGKARALTVELARKAPGAGATVAATVQTHASAHGSDRAGLGADGAVDYTHTGAATQVSFSLTSVRRDGGPATFASGPVAVHGGDRLSVEPLDRALSRARVTVRDAHGRTHSRVVRNRARAAGRIALAAPKVAGRRISVRVKLSGFRGGATLGATLRLMRGPRVVARKALVLTSAAGAHALAWRLPRSAVRGRYRLAIDARAIATAPHATAALASVTAHRTAALALKR